MIKYKLKSLKSTVLLIVIAAALIAAANFFGIGTMRFRTRLCNFQLLIFLMICDWQPLPKRQALTITTNLTLDKWKTTVNL